MKSDKKIFPCLNCGKDTGCANKLICDECRQTKKQNNQISLKMKDKKMLHTAGGSLLCDFVA